PTDVIRCSYHPKKKLSAVGTIHILDYAHLKS
ncbi:MAG: hypothetical protein FYV88_2210, partial [Bacteroidetes bacterium]|nr:hypothetical protein [Bacteroidota bacterium]